MRVVRVTTPFVSSNSRAVSYTHLDVYKRQVELMVREKRSFHLTPAGQYLYRSGKKLLERFHDVKVETTRIGTDARVSLRIGYLNRYSGIAMQQTVIRMAKRYKNLDIRMYSGSHEELYGMLQDRRVDVAFNDQWQVLSCLLYTS